MHELPPILLSANSLNRYLPNSPMLPQFKKDADGGLTFYIQHESPGDTAARYGGDEFVLVLPETESAAAVQVAQRVSEQLNRDGEESSVSVSIGTAVYPQDGEQSNLPG
jgi:hypothetical protein